MADVKLNGVSFNAQAFEGYTEETFTKEMMESGIFEMFEDKYRVELLKGVWKDISKHIKPPTEKVKDKQIEKGAS